MIVTHKVSIDLARWGIPPHIDVMQDDRYSRNLEIALYANGIPFCPGDTCSVLVRYKKADRTGGAYDTLPDGTVAGTVSGNTVTVALAPQVCSAAGKTVLVVGLMEGNAELNSFNLELSVHKTPGGIKSSGEYVNITGFLPQPVQAEAGHILVVDAVSPTGKVKSVRTAETGSGTIPEKGVDYFTEADKQELVDAVLAALPAAEEVRF